MTYCFEPNRYTCQPMAAEPNAKRRKPDTSLFERQMDHFWAEWVPLASAVFDLQQFQFTAPAPATRCAEKYDLAAGFQCGTTCPHCELFLRFALAPFTLLYANRGSASPEQMLQLVSAVGFEDGPDGMHLQVNFDTPIAKFTLWHDTTNDEEIFNFDTDQGTVRLSLLQPVDNITPFFVINWFLNYIVDHNSN